MARLPLVSFLVCVTGVTLLRLTFLMILVVDNDPAVLDQAQQILNRERQVFLAKDSARALDLAGNLGFSRVKRKSSC
jgi:hypothetical protein